MANRKNKSGNSGSDRHKPAKQVRLNLRLAAQLEKLAHRNATSIPIEVNRAVRELLKLEKLWPPADEQNAS